MKNSDEIESKLRDLKPILHEKYKVQNIGYFGSYSEGKQTETSDLDILVDLSEPIGWAFFDLKDFLEDQLNRPVDLITRKALKKQLKKGILRQTTFV